MADRLQSMTVFIKKQTRQIIDLLAMPLTNHDILQQALHTPASIMRFTWASCIFG